MWQISVTFVSAPYLIQPILYDDGCFSIFNPSFITMFFDTIFSLLLLLKITSHTFQFTVHLVQNMLCRCDCSICFGASKSLRTIRERDSNFHHPLRQFHHLHRYMLFHPLPPLPPSSSLPWSNQVYCTTPWALIGAMPWLPASVAFI